ncbi:MAG: hypothetical protein H6588_08150 [Flavobacteriales bacterium]|nr:hypothetical protein [Flavobacteriales bacterium]
MNTFKSFKSLMFLTLFLSFALVSKAQNSTKPQENTKKKITATNNMQSQQPRITTSTRPINNNNNTRLKSVDGGVVIGEGEYLTFTKQIMEHSITGQIPADLPKHVKGQTKQEYLQIIKEWANNHPDQFKQKNSN